MSALDQLQYVSWSIYVVIFVLVSVRAVRRPTPAHGLMALFFGAVFLLIILSSIPSTLGIPAPFWLPDATGDLLVSLAYVQLRLVREFSRVPALVMRGAELGLILSVIAIAALPTPMPTRYALLIVGYFVAVIAYDTGAFIREAQRTSGVTRRRMQAVAAGSACLGLVLLATGAGLAIPDQAPLWSQTAALLGLASGVFYFIGFAPPTWLRRAWQEPELRAFLSRAARLPRLPDTRSIVQELERGSAASLGAPAATIGLWDPDTRRLHYFYSDPPDSDGEMPASPNRQYPASSFTLQAGMWELDPETHPISGRAFREQRASLVTDVQRADPANADLYPVYRARAALSAPITAGETQLGVLVVFAPRAPVFANSDLELVQLLADQAAVVLESRALIDEAARVRAREEATRLKDDFLSSAAHDLKTPLTGLVTQAQLLLRRAERDPRAPVDRTGLERLLQQSLRLRDLVLELLDASRLEQGSLLGPREDLELSTLVREAIATAGVAWQRVKLEVTARVQVHADPVRLEQVITNLVENALKYSPGEAPVLVAVGRDEDQAHLAVTDSGIGIPMDDQPLVFERFHRARNVDDRRFAGMGLGLYIARGIVEQHGGRIWVESVPNRGSTFHVNMPLALPFGARRELPPFEGHAASA